jgi:predicted nucleic acid-binding Zn ribbon protein
MDHANRVLPHVLAAAIRQAPLTPEKVTFAWRQAGGAAIARATAVALTDGVLAVSCADPQWAREVHRIRRELLRQLELWLGPEVVTRIDVAGGIEIRGRRPRRPVSHTSGA